jgi:hypothetical protein
MFDCSNDVVAYHNKEVTLSQVERTAMRDRRNANRNRLETRLADSDRPVPDKFIKQGSYAMLTMVHDPDNDYDIDDGVYFAQEVLVDEKGNDMEPAAVREMVCEALQDGRFNRQPEVLDACVRVFYNEGYHVDLPVYRISEDDGEYELASGDSWVVSRAADVEDWFNQENQQLSPDEDNGRQFRRIVRYLKKYARSRIKWKGKISTGFMITTLAAECYVANRDREDTSLRDTMKRIYFRLLGSLEVNHPVTPNTRLTKGPGDQRCAFLRDRLKEALDELVVLDRLDCTGNDAAKAWDAVFNTTFFSERYESSLAKATALSSLLQPAVPTSGLTFPNRKVLPNKPQGFA